MKSLTQKSPALAAGLWLAALSGAVSLLAVPLTALGQYDDDGITFTFDINYQTNGAFVVGPQHSGDGLIVEDGAVLTSAGAAIGVSGPSNKATGNFAIIRGPSSLWNAQNLDVGQSSALNTLVISNGGSVWGGGTVGGAYSTNANNNTVLITGLGSMWSNGGFVVGVQSSSNVMTVANNAAVFGGMVVGEEYGANGNSLWLRDGGSLRGGLTVGRGGSFNMVVITNGGKLYSSGGVISQAGDTNAVLVTGQGSLWTNTGSLTVGLSGNNGRLTIANTGMVVVPGITLGQESLRNSLVINSGGALVNSGDAKSGTRNSALVTDPGSMWTNGGHLYVDYDGTFNTLVISNGGKVWDSLGTVGATPYDSGNSALVTGTNSTWTNWLYFAVGDHGSSNTLIISDGGSVFNGLGGLLGGLGNRAVVTGGGSSWVGGIGASLEVGSFGSSNSLVISNGGMVISTSASIGVTLIDTNNSVLVTGGAVWTNSNEAYVGQSGALNSLVINGGGAFFATTNFIGQNYSASNNSVLVTGLGSRCINDAVYLGNGGSFNSLEISKGGTMISGPGYVGYEYGSSNNTVLVTGSSSTWTVVGNLYLGYSGDINSLVISNDGRVFAANVYVGFIQYNLANAVTVTNATLTVVGLLDVRAGTLLLSSGLVDVGSLSATNAFSSVQLKSGRLRSGASVITSIGLGPFLVGDGVQQAIYELKDGVHTFTEGLEISSNATLTGCGTVNGNLQVDPGGRVIVNCGTEGNITINGAVTNNGGMAAVNGNVLTVKGPLVNNGVIVVNLNGTNFQGGIIKLGTIVDAGSTRIQGVSSQGGSFSVQIQSDQRLTYQLQYTDSLGSNYWTKIGTPQQGNGGSLSLVDPAPPATGRFYQVVFGF